MTDYNQAAAEAAWERLRLAVLRRMDDPSPENYAECARLRDDLSVAMGEPPVGANVVDFPRPVRRVA